MQHLLNSIMATLMSPSMIAVEKIYCPQLLNKIFASACTFSWLVLQGFLQGAVPHETFVSSFRVEATLQHWFVTGLQQQGTVPSLIASVGEDSSSLLSVVFELNPEDSSADQMLRLYSQPVEIIYDTVIIVYGLFT